MSDVKTRYEKPMIFELTDDASGAAQGLCSPGASDTGGCREGVTATLACGAGGKPSGCNMGNIPQGSCGGGGAATAQCGGGGHPSP